MHFISGCQVLTILDFKTDINKNSICPMAALLEVIPQLKILWPQPPPPQKQGTDPTPDLWWPVLLTSHHDSGAPQEPLAWCLQSSPSVNSTPLLTQGHNNLCAFFTGRKVAP